MLYTAELRGNGIEPTFVTGLLQDADGKRVTSLMDGEKLAIQADNRSQTVKSIAERATGLTLDIAGDTLNENRNGGLRIGRQAENPAAAIGQQANAGQTETAPAAEAAEAGNDLADGGRGRLSGQRAGEQDGRVAKLAEARSAASQFDTASRRRSDAKNLPSERVNARDHIAEAVEGSTITFAPEQMVQQDKELRTVKRRLESVTGRKVYYTVGGIKRTGADGKTGTARGAITPDGIYLRCDDDSASVTQLAGHELYHYYEEQFPGLHDRVRQKITERYSEEEFREIAGRYAEKLGRLNGMAEDMDAESYEAMVRRIESEIFADAFRNINYFRMGADRYTEAARETVNETLGSETAAATERRTGPPETQFSFSEKQSPTYEELIKKAPIPVTDIRRKQKLRFANERENFVNSEAAKKMLAAPVVNKDTGEPVFIVPQTFTHTFNNKGWEQIELAYHLPEIIENAVYTHGESSRKAPRDHTTGVYTLFGAARTAEGVKPVKLTVKEYNAEGQKLPPNVQNYLGTDKPNSPYASTYDGRVLVLESIENEASGSAGSALSQMESAEDYPETSSITVKNLLGLVKGDARKYIPNPETSFSASEDEDIPESAAEYSRQRYREENREPQRRKRGRWGAGRCWTRRR